MARSIDVMSVGNYEIGATKGYEFKMASDISDETDNFIEISDDAKFLESFKNYFYVETSGQKSSYLADGYQSVAEFDLALWNRFKTGQLIDDDPPIRMASEFRNNAAKAVNYEKELFDNTRLANGGLDPTKLLAHKSQPRVPLNGLLLDVMGDLTRALEKTKPIVNDPNSPLYDPQRYNDAAEIWSKMAVFKHNNYNPSIVTMGEYDAKMVQIHGSSAFTDP